MFRNGSNSSCKVQVYSSSPHIAYYVARPHIIFYCNVKMCWKCGFLQWALKKSNWQGKNNNSRHSFPGLLPLLNSYLILWGKKFLILKFSYFIQSHVVYPLHCFIIPYLKATFRLLAVKIIRNFTVYLRKWLQVV